MKPFSPSLPNAPTVGKRVGANRRELLLRHVELRVDGANVGPRSHREIDRRLLVVRRRRSGSVASESRELERRVERQD